jgi:hypothetical protein
MMFIESRIRILNLRCTPAHGTFTPFFKGYSLLIKAKKYTIFLLKSFYKRGLSIKLIQPSMSSL